ncbi:MAG: LON peptidase substrate-binding domain-containing protein [Aeromicrobium sp.]
MSHAVAMFPLGSVLVPGMPLPLHLFEPRYLAMLDVVLQSEPAHFGVVLIERGHEVGGGEVRFDVGTLAQVEQVEKAAGRAVLIARGTRRFAVDRWLPDDPFPRADLTEVAEPHWHESLRPSLQRAEDSIRRDLARASEYVELMWGPETVLSDDPVERCWQLLGICIAGPLDQVRLLRCDDLEQLLAEVVELSAAALETVTFGRSDDGF